MRHNALWALPPDSAENILLDLSKELSTNLNVDASFVCSRAASHVGGQSPTDAASSLEGSQLLATAVGFNESISEPTPPYTLRNGVAVIQIHSVIDRVARISWFTGQPYTAGQDIIRTAINVALADPAVNAILLSIDSSGGVVAGTKELADFIAHAASQKPMAAYADGLCASAAYWLASATGRVYAPVTATVGSIGVIAVLTDWSKASEKNGVVRTMITGGKWKAAGSPDKPLSDEEREYFQAQITQLHGIFKTDVATRMNIAADPELWAEGQTLLATDAQAVGLVSVLVRDEGEAVATLSQISKENHMNKDEFKAKNPELYAQIMADAKAEFEAEFTTKMPNALAEAGAKGRESALALVKAVAGEEVFNRVSGIAAAGITPEQLAALAPLLAGANASATPQAQNVGTQSPSQTQNAESAARAEMLAAITNATGGALPTGAEVSKTQKSALVADAERRAACGSLWLPVR